MHGEDEMPPRDTARHLPVEPERPPPTFAQTDEFESKRVLAPSGFAIQPNLQTSNFKSSSRPAPSLTHGTEPHPVTSIQAAVSRRFSRFGFHGCTASGG